jgi:hypothetical protein
MHFFEFFCILLLIINPRLIYLRLSLPLEMRDTPEQAAHLLSLSLSLSVTSRQWLVAEWGT